MNEEITVTVLDGEVFIWPACGPEPSACNLRQEYVAVIASCDIFETGPGDSFVWEALP